MLSKKEFIKQYKQLPEEEKKQVKRYHEKMKTYEILSGFEDIVNTAKKCLLWIREAEENN